MVDPEKGYPPLQSCTVRPLRSLSKFGPECGPHLSQVCFLGYWHIQFLDAFINSMHSNE